jgi:hypothetical protein
VSDDYPLSPKMHFLEMPWRIGNLTKTVAPDGTELMLVHPAAEFDLCQMSPREAWKYKHRKARLKRGGIVLTETKGLIGSLSSVRVE